MFTTGVKCICIRWNEKLPLSRFIWTVHRLSLISIRRNFAREAKFFFCFSHIRSAQTMKNSAPRAELVQVRLNAQHWKLPTQSPTRKRDLSNDNVYNTSMQDMFSKCFVLALHIQPEWRKRTTYFTSFIFYFQIHFSIVFSHRLNWYKNSRRVKKVTSRSSCKYYVKAWFALALKSRGSIVLFSDRQSILRTSDLKGRCEQREMWTSSFRQNRNKWSLLFHPKIFHFCVLKTVFAIQFVKLSDFFGQKCFWKTL